jgi:GTPase SAR1 family protein
VTHFCPGLPVILVGCKKDLRRERKVIEELKKTGQQPVTTEEVCIYKCSVILLLVLTGGFMLALSPHAAVIALLLLCASG